MVDHPPGAAASIALVPLSVMLLLCWLGAPTWPGGRLLVTGTLGALIVLVARLALPRKRVLRVAPDSELSWETCIDGDDPYRVVLVQGGRRVVVLEHDDPAVVLADARRVSAETGSHLVGPAWLTARGGVNDSAANHTVSPVSVVGLSSSGQLRTATATLGGSAFVLLVFLVSVKAEAGVSLLSAALPLASVAITALIGAGLSSLRVRATRGPDGIEVQRVVFGWQLSLLNVPAEQILSVQAVGHAPHPERHVLVDTVDGPRSFALAGEAARQLARQAQPNRPALHSESARKTPNRPARDPVAETSP
jgi:hypothetical protein